VIQTGALTATCIEASSSPHRVVELLDEEAVIGDKVGCFTLDMVSVAAATNIETKSISKTNIETSSLATVTLGCIQPTVIRNEVAPDVIGRPRLAIVHSATSTISLEQKSHDWTDRITSADGDSSKLCKSLSSLMQREE